MNPFPYWRGAACVSLIALAQASHAATPAGLCPISDAATGQPPPASQLKSLEPQCLHSAAYYRQLGLAWQLEGQPVKAQEALERALLLEPEHSTTQLHYALALLQLGDTLAATQLLQQLRDNPQLPPELQNAAQAALAATQATNPWAHRVSVAVSAVADSNLNNAALAGELTLTLPQGNLTLPVAPELRRQSGVTELAQLQWAAVRPQGQQLWLLQADLRHRHASAASHRYTQTEAAATWLQAPDAPRQWLGRAQLSQLQWGGQRLYAGDRLGLQHQWRLSGDCRLALGAETETRHYPSASTLNGDYRGSIASATCHRDATDSQWQLHWRQGQDSPSQASRPGGRYQQQDWRLAWQGPLQAGRLALDYQYSSQTDATGYSPLLASNAARSQWRQALGMEYSQAMPQLPGWQWFVGLDYSRQRSNLALFSADRQALSVGMRWNTP